MIRRKCLLPYLTDAGPSYKLPDRLAHLPTHIRCGTVIYCANQCGSEEPTFVSGLHFYRNIPLTAYILDACVLRSDPCHNRRTTRTTRTTMGSKHVDERHAQEGYGNQASPSDRYGQEGGRHLVEEKKPLLSFHLAIAPGSDAISSARRSDLHHHPPP